MHEEQKEETSPLPASDAEKKSLATTINWATFIAFFTSTLTAAAYLTGVAFHQGYLHTYKVSYGLFPKTSSEYFLYAYSAILELVPQFFSFDKTTGLLIISAFCALVLIFSLRRLGKYIDDSVAVAKIRTKVRSAKSFGLVGDLFFYPVLGVVIPLYLLFLLFFLLLAPALVGELGGERAAKREIAAQEGGCAKPKGVNAYCIDILASDKLLARGFIVDMSEKYVAIRVDGLTKTIPIKDRDFVPFVNPVSVATK